MSLAAASVLLVLLLPFVLWPLLRHEQALAGDEESAARRARAADEADRQRALLLLEELDLDEASGRLDEIEAGRRRAELRREAEHINW